jgi:S-adenosylhomocysteine hydrolase
LTRPRRSRFLRTARAILYAALGLWASAGWAGRFGSFRAPLEHERDAWYEPPRPKHRVVMRSFTQMVKPQAARKPFRGWKLIGEQHFEDSTGELLRAIAESGIEPNDQLLIGDPKSAHTGVIQDLRNEGFRINYGPLYSLERHALTDPENYLNSILRGDIKATARIPGGLGADPKARYLILDDGGKLLEYINDHFPQLKGRVVGVEQTSGGSRKLDKKKLWFPVIDVGRSWGKLNFESPIIARSVGNATQKKLERLRQRGIDPGREIVLCGYGPLGQRMAEDLKSRGYTVKVYDRVLDGDGPEAAAMREIARRSGVTTVSRAEAITTGRVFITVTGEAATVTTEDYEHMADGAIFINAAQSGAYQVTDEMYQDPKLRRTVERYPYPMVTEFRGKRIAVGDDRSKLTGDYVIRARSGKQFLLVGNNRAVNFDKQKAHTIPPRYIQSIRGFLYLGLEQAVRALEEGKEGLQELELKPQRKYIGKVEAELRARGESLLAPRF